jgi:tetratricopeptide (TPR) repeat protein
MRHNILSLSGGLLLAAGTALGQLPPLTLPQASPAASVSETVALTDITIRYHRPAVNKRKIWGELVPYNEVWRAGANENTTLDLSTPATVGGHRLPAGVYGLHMIPTENEWTIIVSNMADAWGSFSYDQKEDAARFTATPRPADFQERLDYRFENVTNDSATAILHWEKLEVPFVIQIDRNATVVASLKKQLRGLPRFGWQAWNQAAAWCVQNDADLDQALEWADHSISLQATFPNLRTKARIMEKKGDAKAADELMARAMKIATETDLNNYGYFLLNQQKNVDQAIAIFQKNVKDHPDSWNTYDSLGEAYAAKGDKKLAILNYSKALSMATDETQKKRISDILAKLKA